LSGEPAACSECRRFAFRENLGSAATPQNHRGSSNPRYQRFSGPRPSWADRSSRISRAVAGHPPIGVVRRPFKEPPLTAESGGATRAALLAMRAHRGTGGSNPPPSSRQSVSRGISPCGIEKPAVAAGAQARPGGTAGRDPQGSSKSRQLRVVSLSGAIPVPQCRLAVRDRGCTGAPSEVGLAM